MHTLCFTKILYNFDSLISTISYQLVGCGITFNLPISWQKARLIGLGNKFSFRFLKCYIGQPSQPVCVKLSSSSCLEPWPHPGKGTLPMPAQAGKLSSGRNGGYTRPKGPFHPVEGQGVNCPLPGPRAPASLGGEAVSTS